MALRVVDTSSGHYEYVLVKVEKLSGSLHYLPLEQCPSPSCGDIGQECYWVDKQLYFYCPYCFTHYKVVFTDKGVLNKRR